MQQLTRSRAKPLIVGCLLAAASIVGADVANADGVRFSDFTPLTASAGPTADEATPITLSNAAFQQRSVADRATQLAAGAPNSGTWDMITVNETGPHKGRYLFTVFETGQAGVQRHDWPPGGPRRSGTARSRAITWRSTPPTGPRGERTSPPRSPGARLRRGAPPAPTAACSS